MNVEEQHGELIGTIQVTTVPGGFMGVEIGGALSAQLIDELPVIAGDRSLYGGGGDDPRCEGVAGEGVRPDCAGG